MSSSIGEWVCFFGKAGIPSGEAASYALIFSKNRIQKNMLDELNKEYLRDMGITPLGDIIAILKHARKVHESDSREMFMSEAAEKIEQAPSDYPLIPSKIGTPSPYSSTAVNELKSKEPIQTSAKRGKVDHKLPFTSNKLNEEMNIETKPVVESGTSSISVSDSNDESDDTQSKTISTTRLDQADIKPHSLRWKSKIVSTRKREEPSPANKLCVFSRLGNAAAKSERIEQSPLPKDVARARPAANNLVPKRISTEQPIIPSVKDLSHTELKGLKITTEFSDDDDIQINAPEQAIAAKITSHNVKSPRKRQNSNDALIANDALPTVEKKVRFGGASMRVIPDGPLPSPLFRGHTVVVKSPSSSLEKIPSANLAGHKNIPTQEIAGSKVNGARSRLAHAIKTRIGVVRPTPAKPISKMVSDSILSKMDVPKKSVKSRIDLKRKSGKISVLERLG